MTFGVGEDELAALTRPVRGFAFAGVASGIKSPGTLDLGAIVAEKSVPAAGVLTQNIVRAAPVDICASRLEGGMARAVLVNSGNANAATGTAGWDASIHATRAFAHAAKLPEDEVLPASTGVIGVVLPASCIVDSAPALVSGLRPEGAADFARAILTTDRGPKVARREFSQDGRTTTVLAIAKGAGMIHPDMATTLAFVVTDAKIDGENLRAALRDATDETFNRITVDGDTSTNDSILALASGDGPSAHAGDFSAALRETLDVVSKMIVADGEGARHVATIMVRGALSHTDATAVARTIATSPLVKTAMHGRDPNWGRIIAAAGRAGVPFDPRLSSVVIGDVLVFDQGVSVMDADREARASEIMERAEYTIEVALGSGSGEAHYLTCDLGHPYVTLNADYRS